MDAVGIGVVELVLCGGVLAITALAVVVALVVFERKR